MKVLLFAFLLTMTVSSAQDRLSETLTSEKEKWGVAIVGIDGMACQEGCADKISSNLLQMDGVKTAQVSYSEKEAIITFDTGLVTPTALQKTITNTKVKEYVYSINSITIKE